MIAKLTGIIDSLGDGTLVIDVRGKPKRATVVKKPIYRKES